MAWVYLFTAGLFEVAFAISLKGTQGFTRPLPILLTIGFMLVSLWLLSLSMRSLPLGTAYAIWTGIGTVGSVIAGIRLYGEGTDPARLACVGLILAGVGGLKFLSLR
ncbi:DMT family transporter [Niveispirillum fermenti]|uniref:DMT family transporter n=1 Tax=Niveispirillum fermenti TaxID=1233113 RepID=UPI003A869C74